MGVEDLMDKSLILIKRHRAPHTFSADVPSYLTSILVTKKREPRRNSHTLTVPADTNKSRAAKGDSYNGIRTGIF